MNPAFPGFDSRPARVTQAEAQDQTSTPLVFVSLSSFGAADARRHGQLRFAAMAVDAGADGIEVRGELFSGARAELQEIGALARERAASLVYSSPEGLWADDGSIDEGALERGLDAAWCLGAQRLKMSMGSHALERASGVARLSHVLASHPTELVIENDQTERGGTLPALQALFDAARSADLSLGMTFDIGNWHWVGEDPLQAAATLATWVSYVHCKGARGGRANGLLCPGRIEPRHGARYCVRCPRVPRAHRVPDRRRRPSAATTCRRDARADGPGAPCGDRTMNTMLDVVTLGEAMVMLVADEAGPLERVHSSTSAPRVPRPTWRSASHGSACVSVGQPSRRRLDGKLPAGGNAARRRRLLARRANAPRHAAASSSRAASPMERPAGRIPRSGSAASRMTVAHLDEDWLRNARHLHVTGVFPALSASCSTSRDGRSP